MSPTHLHLILNHIPVLGTVFGVGVLILALSRRNEDLKKTALGVFVIVALMAVPVYLTGEPAEDTVGSIAGVSNQVIEQHEEAASVAFAGAVVLGVAALAGLLFSLSGRILPAWVSSIMLAASLIVSGLMAWTANLGGQIRHAEVGSTAAREQHADRN